MKAQYSVDLANYKVGTLEVELAVNGVAMRVFDSDGYVIKNFIGEPQDMADNLCTSLSVLHEHPEYPVADWKTEIANDETRESYKEWVESCRNGDG